jgi:serine protease Do
MISRKTPRFCNRKKNTRHPDIHLPFERTPVMTTLIKKYWILPALAFALILCSPALHAQEDPDAASETQSNLSAEDTNGDQEIAIVDFPVAVENSETDQFLFNGKLPTSMDDLQSMEERFKKLSEKLMPATVNIQMFSGANGPSQGSGVVVSADGYILTAAHVIGEPNQIANIVFPDGKTYKAKTLGVNTGVIDSGMLKIVDDNDTFFPHVNLGISSSLKLGQWVLAIGHPGGWDKDRGLVTRIGRVIGKTSRVIRTDCTLVGGDSGGPLFDMNGELIGIHSRIGRTLSDNYHVPVDQYSDNWDKMAQGLVLNGRPYFGVDVVDSSNEIKSVNEKSPAAKAGLKKGDIILAIDATEIGDKAAIKVAFSTVLPNQKITVRIKREDEERELEVIVGRK